MKDKRIIIVDNDITVAKDLASCIEKIGYSVVDCFQGGEALLSFLKSDNKVDIILMDILLSGKINGFELAKIIRKEFNYPIIFLTSYADDAIINEVKILEPEGYIVKPFKEIDLRINIEMAFYKNEKNKEENNKVTTLSSKNFIYVKSNSKLIKIENNNIFFVEALKDYVRIHTHNKKFTILSTMKDITKRLNQIMFLRVHRSYIININKIESIEGNNIVLEHINANIPIGGSYKNRLFTELNFV